MAEAQPHAPTPAEAAAVAAAGGQALTDQPANATEAQIEAAVTRAMERRGKELNVQISEDQYNAIAAAVIAQLEARGAFDRDQPPATTTDAPADPAAAAPGAPEPAPGDAPPRKLTLAERFVGRK